MVPFAITESGTASAILSGHTEFGNVFVYSSWPRAIMFAFTASLSTLPFWLGNRYPLRRNASPNGLRTGYTVWHVRQLVWYLRAKLGTAPASRVIAKNVRRPMSDATIATGQRGSLMPEPASHWSCHRENTAISGRRSFWPVTTRRRRCADE